MVSKSSRTTQTLKTAWLPTSVASTLITTQVQPAVLPTDLSPADGCATHVGANQGARIVGQIVEPVASAVSEPRARRVDGHHLDRRWRPDLTGEAERGRRRRRQVEAPLTGLPPAT